MGVSVQQKIKSYGLIIIGILLFQCIVISVVADPSQGRWGHSAVLINNNRLYVYGGADTSNTFNELMYLDVSNPFNPVSPPWVLPPSDGSSPRLVFHSCSSGGNQNELLIFFGGQTNEPDNFIFIYNTTEENWVTPPPIQNGPSSRGNHTTVTRQSDSTVYLWGGTPIGNNEEVTALNDLYQLTTSTIDAISWNVLANSNTVLGRWDHSATLLNDGRMYIIGGVTSGNVLAPMTYIPIYDTNEATWTIGTAAGDLVTQRRAHKAVGTSDNRIIIYGGTSAEYDVKLTDVAVLYVTDLTNLTWSTPQVIGTTPPGRYSHSMTLVGSKAIVAFGSVDNDAERKLFVLDTDSYTWETTYNPKNTSPPGLPPTSSSTGSSGNKGKSNLGIIVGIPVAGGIIVLVLVGLLYFWIRKRRGQQSFSAVPYEKQQASIPPIAGPAPAPLHNLNNYGSSSPPKDGVDGTPFIPPFATSSYQRRQNSFGSTSETRNLTPVDQHDSWGSAPSNSSQSQLPQINPSIPLFESMNLHSPTTPKTTSSHNPNVPYSSTSSSQHPPSPPSSTPTPPPISPQKDLFPTSAAAGASSSTKTSPSTNLRLDSDSNIAPVEFDYPPPVAPLSFNRTRTPSPSQAQVQQLTTPPRLPISTSSSSSSLPRDSTNALVSSPTGMEAERATTSTGDEGGMGIFNSPLFRTETLSPIAGTAAAASPADRTLSLRSVPRLNTSTPRNSTGLSSPPPISAGGRLRSDGQSDSRPTSPINNNNNSDDQPRRGRLFVANPDPSDSD